MANDVFSLDTSGFEGALAQLAARSRRSDAEQIRLNATDILRSIAFNSPRQTGNMNAGWIPAWQALGISGKPNTTRSLAPFTVGGKGGGAKGRPASGNTRQYVPDGAFVDQRATPLLPFFEFVNRSHYINAQGKKIYYPYIVATRKDFMRRAEAEIAQKFERRLEKVKEHDARASGF